MYSCYSILECYNLFSGVRLSIRPFYFISAMLIKLSEMILYVDFALKTINLLYVNVLDPFCLSHTFHFLPDFYFDTASSIYTYSHRPTLFYDQRNHFQ